MHDDTMVADRSAAALQARLTEVRARYPGADPQMVSDVVRALLSTMQGDLSATETSLLSEVEALGQTIANAKSEIAALKVDDITASHIPLATDELDAIVAHTAAATESILETCETLDTVAGELAGPDAAARAGAASAQLQEATTKIYEACGFQDITGQRITKIVAALKVIEAKVAQIVTTFGERGRQVGQPHPAAAVADVNDPASLLNGPQLPTAAMDQTDIDKLLAEFD